MARFERNARKDSKAQEISEPEVTEVAEVADTTEAASVPAQATEDDFDDLMASFTNDAVNETAETEDSEMAKQDVTEVQDAEVIEDVKQNALSDAVKEMDEKVNGHSVEMLSVDSLPPTVPHIASAITGLQPIVDMIKAAVEEWNANTSGTAEKVKHAIANLTKESDPEAFKLREAIIAAKAQIVELEEMIERDEPKLYETVENQLAKQGDVMWSEDTKNEKREFINALYAGYVSQHKGVEQFIEAHNKVAADTNKVGTLEQYHTKLDKPFKRTGAKAGATGVRKSSGAPRNVSVGEASVSYDGGVTWIKGEGRFSPEKDLVSNPTFLAAQIAKISKESGNDLKARIYADWYGANGSSDGSPLPAEDVKDVTEFDLTYADKAGDLKTAKVRIVKKSAASE